ncbi:MAG: class I SAM-dependent methyltransferase [Rhodospirillaceae bacterium]|nr:class I SAM-dependent methyltransferase [Rhodospirillaceae bacterium]
MQDVYQWAYLDPHNARLLDKDFIVSTILLGNNRRLKRALLAEVGPGSTALQAAHVYGGLIPELARHIGHAGRLDVIDVVPLQAELCRQKLADLPQAEVFLADAAEFSGRQYDLVSCFFLLHELPDMTKHAVVDNLLSCLAEGGRAVFIDYHRPVNWHPLRPVMRMIYNLFEPFAASMWKNDICTFACDPGLYDWEKRTYFGGIYQKVVVTRRRP